MSVFSLQSVPAGLTVAYKSASTAQNLVTPTNVTPAFSNFATTMTFQPTNGAPPYLYVTQQNANGNHTVLYNQLADTSGSIGSISASSVAFRPSATRARAAARLPRRRSLGSLGRPKFSATRLVVRYRLDALRTLGRSPLDVERSANVARGVDIGFPSAGLATRVVEVSPGDTQSALSARLRARPEVASVAPEGLFYLQAAPPFTPNDPHFNNTEQWDMFKIAALGGWGYTMGSPSIAIAMIDTGVDFTSPDFAGGKITFGEKIVDGVTTPGIAAAIDTDGHGTNVAGIASADTNNAFGFAGVGFNVGLQIYRVFPDGTPSDQYSATANEGDITQAIYDAVKNHAKVINLSLGTCNVEGVNTLLQAAVEYALSQNVVVVAAAGNEHGGSSTDQSCKNGSSTIDFPAAFSGVISVGASALHDVTPNVYATATEYVASYSNSGSGLSLVAPGGDPNANDENPSMPIDYLHWIEGLYSTAALDPNNKCPNPADCVALFAGTSQATPHVAGAAALLLSVNPNLTPAQVAAILTTTADDIADPNEGNGRLDVYRALAAVENDPNPPAAPSNKNFVAFAYTPNGTNSPQILDVTFPHGVPVNSDGTFRVVDVPQGAANYKVGVWYDANGNGVVDAGDYFGSTASVCSATTACAGATGIVAHRVTSGFTLQ